jgi:hypothetical protein
VKIRLVWCIGDISDVEFIVTVDAVIIIDDGVKIRKFSYVVIGE